VKIEFLKYIESGFRSARDDLIFRPLARSHRIKRYVHSDYDLVVQSFDDHAVKGSIVSAVSRPLPVASRR